MMENQQELVVALVGNPNSGKSTIFNNLTGAFQHVGNYPGVTVESKQGHVDYKGYSITIVDLPGTYSLSAYSEDEAVTRNFIIQKRPDVIVHIVDASNLERNLYLFTQLVELDIPIILAMNMVDIVENKGQKIDYDELSRLLKSPVVPTVGNKNKGMQALLDAIVNFKATEEKVHIPYGEEIQQELDKIVALLEKEKQHLKGYPVKWLAVKLLEADSLAIDVIRSLPSGNDIFQQSERSREYLRELFEDEPEVVIADRRYGFISGACMQVIRLTPEEHHNLSDKIDMVVLNRFLGLPIFAFVMYIIFKFTFSFSAPVIRVMEIFFDKISVMATKFIPEGIFQSFIVDGIIGGIGSVLSFFPLVIFMFFAIAFFEDSGYMARAAFIMDKIMHKFGLHGKSFVPMMISTNGCAVPGIMAARTLENKKDRLITMMVTPFMICGAKLPIFALFIGVFFPDAYKTNIMFLMYAISIGLAFGSAWVLKRFILKGEPAYFVMELPPYRVPTLKGLLLKVWTRARLYLKKAATIILLISVLVWAGFSFPEINKEEITNSKDLASIQLEQSIAGRLGRFMEPILRPIGLDWQASIALISGLAAKEVVVTTFGTMYSLQEGADHEALREAIRNDPSWNSLKAFSFLIFCMIYPPCIAAISVFYRETGSSLKWTLFLFLGTIAMAWLVAFIVYQVGNLFYNLV